MGAGQIGGIATLLDIDFDNAAGFIGHKAEVTEAQFMIYYLSQAMMFCVGAIIEPHVILTPASCVFGEKYKFDVYGGSHKFLENAGVARKVHHVCIHKGYNHTNRWEECSTDNVALLVLDRQYSVYNREPGADFVINRVRYGEQTEISRIGDPSCCLYGWGSRRNGYLIPLMIDLRRLDVTILPVERCRPMWNFQNKYLCIREFMCKPLSLQQVKLLVAKEAQNGIYIYINNTLFQSDKFGSLCPDDLGSVIVCSGFVQGIMTSRLVDRPCGTGFLDLARFSKFLTCGVDDSRDVVQHAEFMAIDVTTLRAPETPILVTRSKRRNHTDTD